MIKVLILLLGGIQVNMLTDAYNLIIILIILMKLQVEPS